MPKIKTHKATAKRIGLTASGKLRRRQAMQSHNMSKKNANRKRRLGRPAAVVQADVKRLRRLLAQ